MAVWEVLALRRQLQNAKSARWFSNLGIVFIDALALRLLPSLIVLPFMRKTGKYPMGP